MMKADKEVLLHIAFSATIKQVCFLRTSMGLLLTLQRSLFFCGVSWIIIISLNLPNEAKYQALPSLIVNIQ